MPKHDMKPKLTTTPLLSQYHGEEHDASMFRGAPPTKIMDDGGAFDSVATRYFTGAEQRARRVRVGKRRYKGLLIDVHGRPIDTSKATGQGAFSAGGQNTGAGKYIYVLTPGGIVRAADAWAERQASPKAGPLGPDERRAYQAQYVNHSSLAAGGDVAAAGELAVDRGKLQQISDTSGHYRPTNDLFYQTFAHLADKGVDMRDVTARFGAHSDTERPLLTSAAEFMNQGGARDAKDQMWSARRAFVGDLQRELAAREVRREGGVARLDQEETAMTDEVRDLYGTAQERRGMLGLPQKAAPGGGGSCYTTPSLPALGQAAAAAPVTLPAPQQPGPRPSWMTTGYTTPPRAEAQGGAVEAADEEERQQQPARPSWMTTGYTTPPRAEAQGGAVEAADEVDAGDVADAEEEEGEDDGEFEPPLHRARRAAALRRRMVTMFSRFA